MDLTTIATRTGIPARQLRYASDHHLLAGLPDTKPGRGSARQYAIAEALGLALAAALHGAALSRAAIHAVTGMLADAAGRADAAGKSPLPDLTNGKVVSVEIADGTFVRLGRQRKSGPLQWSTLAGAAKGGHVEAPLVLTRIDLDELRQRLLTG
jgi:hypothetical protein